MGQHAPTVYFIAGPNGAGKSSAAPLILASRVPLDRYVNPDAIALAINPDDPYAARRAAGAHAIASIRALEHTRLDFALETTLSGQWTTRLMERLIAAGYVIDLTYLWLPSVEDALDRVRFRVERQGGHYVPPEDVRRRFYRSLINFEIVTRSLVRRWHLSDAGEPGTAPIIAQGHAGDVQIWDTDRWANVRQVIQAAQVMQPGRTHDRSS
jgi:predicted ABC-type ATPase